MPQIIDIQRVTVLPKTIVARVRVDDDAPLMTDEDFEGTEHVLDLMPELEHHMCLGDVAPSFGEVAQMTEVAHLLEHVSVELMARTELGGAISAGRTRQAGEDARTFEIELDCSDDVLGAGALSSAAWILEWAYTGGGDPTPDIDGIVEGLVQLVNSLEPVELIEPEYPAEAEDEQEEVLEDEPVDEPEDASKDEIANEPEQLEILDENNNLDATVVRAPVEAQDANVVNFVPDEMPPESDPTTVLKIDDDGKPVEVAAPATELEAEVDEEQEEKVEAEAEAEAQSGLVFEDGIAVMPSSAAPKQEDDEELYPEPQEQTASEQQAEIDTSDPDSYGYSVSRGEFNWFSSYSTLMKNLEKADED